MQSVILIGDSIRMGYQPVVQQQLREVATVWGPTMNGGTSRNVLEHLDEWSGPAADVIHVNCGLHDLKKDFGQTQTAVPLTEYEQNVRQILQWLKSNTKAVVLWASTTPVNEQWHHERKGFDRFAADVDAFNATAKRVAKECGVTVHDLFSVGQKAVQADNLTEDGVHFTPAGYQQLGEAVAQFVRA